MDRRCLLRPRERRGRDHRTGALTVSGLILGADGLRRCGWASRSDDEVAYHDDEWGRPVRDDDAMFERMCLEGFQSGLSWLTILRKRPAFRAAFAGFRIDEVARFGTGDVEELLGDAGIVRHRGKIEAAIANAAVAAAIREREGSFAAFVWSFAPPPGPAPATMSDVPVVTDASTALSKELRRRGARFVGPTTMYALMQATGMVNDHLAGCHARETAGPPPA